MTRSILDTRWQHRLDNLQNALKKIVLTLFSPFSQDARTLESNHDSDQGKMYLEKIVQDIYKLFDIFHQTNFLGYELVATTSDGKKRLAETLIIFFH